MNMYEYVNSRSFLTYTTVILQPQFEYVNICGCSTENWYNYSSRTKVWIAQIPLYVLYSP